jgi:hypothetical protein
MSHSRLLGALVRWRERATERRRLEAERLKGPHPRAGGWYVVGGLGHLYFNRSGEEPPVPRPVCGAASLDGAAPMDINTGDLVCPACDAHLHDVYFVQIA